ncbi:ankyrin repeat domain-containing protein 17-like [Pollicipes pollicipes]|uniref:ankyrin repeat domain-containing protein 17-like n=1 Tax=Pollicipes pollicipes TaxID=41117 RepID=UPI0018855541|nr:ankyrin repeat domain-containing protein 17-like [Pollicipes pollicipes]
MALLISEEKGSDEEGDPPAGGNDSQGGADHMQGSAQQTPGRPLFSQNETYHPNEDDVISQDETTCSNDSSAECPNDADGDDDDDYENEDAESVPSASSTGEGTACARAYGAAAAPPAEASEASGLEEVASESSDLEAAASGSSDSEAAAQPLSGPVTGGQLVRRAEFHRQQRLDIQPSIVQYLRDNAALSRLKITLDKQETVTSAEQRAFRLEKERLRHVHQQLQQRLWEKNQEIAEDFRVIHQHEEVPMSPQRIAERSRRFLPEFLVNRAWFSGQQSPLAIACSRGNFELVCLLLDCNAVLEHTDAAGFTPLMMACGAGHPDIVQLLLYRGANPRHQSSSSLETPLLQACFGGHHEVVRILIQMGVHLEQRNLYDNTPLMLAAARGSVGTIRLLLRAGVNINSRLSSRLDITPLMMAACHGHLDVVRYLLRRGCDITAQMRGGKGTALTVACLKGHADVVGLLLLYGANPCHLAKFGRGQTKMTPLMAAAYRGFPKVAEVLLQRMIDINATVPGGGGKTALMIAAWRGHVSFVQLLISRGVAIEARNKAGRTALWWALDAGHGTIARLLQACGASVDVQDTRQVSCIMAAYRRGNVELVRWLLECVSQLPSDEELERCLRSRSKKRSMDLDGPTLQKSRASCLYFIRAERERRGC